MKNRVAFICCYFGRLPNYFQLWLDSCFYNDQFDWIIFTDDATEFNIPTNVRIVESSFDDICQLIQRSVDFATNICNAYKMCDFKVLYGVAFKEYLKGYTHWGHCDLDVIYGRLDHFINDELLEKYDRLFRPGHLSIYKNNDIVNNYYRLSYSGISYKTILNSKYHFGFDESKGMDLICDENNISLYDKVICADIDFYKFDFNIHNYKNDKNQYFEYDNGELWLCTHDKKILEFAYIHLQKRKMTLNCKIKKNHYYIIPNSFENMIPKKNNKLNKIRFEVNSRVSSLRIKLIWNYHWKIMWLLRRRKK